MTQDTLTTLRAAFEKCKQLSIESGAYESYKAVGKAFEELSTLIAPLEAAEPIAYCSVEPMRKNESVRKFKIVWANGVPKDGPLYTHAQPVEQAALSAAKDAALKETK